MDATKTTFKAGFEKLNKDIERFPHVFPITEDMHVTYKGVSRLVMLDRYSYKDSTKETLSEGDIYLDGQGVIRNIRPAEPALSSP